MEVGNIAKMRFSEMYTMILHRNKAQIIEKREEIATEIKAFFLKNFKLPVYFKDQPH